MTKEANPKKYLPALHETREVALERVRQEHGTPEVSWEDRARSRNMSDGRFDILNDRPGMWARMKELILANKRKVAVGALATAVAVGALEYGFNGNQAVNGNLARENSNAAHDYLSRLNGEPQSGLDAQGNRHVYINGQEQVIPAADLNQSSGDK